MSDQTFLVGTGSARIYTCRLTASGQLQLLHETATGKATSWLLARGNYLYSTNEEDGLIETFSIDDRRAGKLTSKGKVTSHGSTPCSLDIDPSGQWLAVANYGDKDAPSFVLLPLNNSHLPEAKSARIATVEGRGPHPERQNHSHCHQVQFHGDHLYGVDLGTDTISIYTYKDELKLTGDRIRTRPGSGPRHFLFDPERSLVFLANELDSTTEVYRVDSALLQWQRLQTITTRQKPDSSVDNTPAEIHLTPDRKYLLLSNRGDNNLVIYKINDDEKEILTLKEHLDGRGAGARYFTFDPTGRFLLVANKRSNNLICFSYDHQHGAFEFVSQLLDLDTPQHLVFLA